MKFHLLKPQTFSDLDSFLQTSGEKRETVQSILTRHVMEDKLETFKSKLTVQNGLVHERAWLTSLTDPNAGRWLSVVPRINDFQFSNLYFQVAIRYRLYLDQDIIVDG